METATSTVIFTATGMEYTAEYPLPMTREIPAEHVARYVREGLIREAEAEHLRLVSGGRNGVYRPSDEAIQQLMAVWAPGRNYLAEQRAKRAAAHLEARKEALRAKLAKLEGDPNQLTLEAANG